MSILDYVYSPGLHGSYVGSKIRDCVPTHAVAEHDAEEECINRRTKHQFEDSIGGDSSNYKKYQNII